MPYYDMPKHELTKYMPELALPDDAESFWSTTLAESRAAAQPAEWRKVETGLNLVDTFDVAFSGFGGQRVKAWLHLPANIEAPVPAVVRFQGYGGGRGLPHEVSVWPDFHRS